MTRDTGIHFDSYNGRRTAVRNWCVALSVAAFLAPVGLAAQSFDSGSDGSDGALNVLGIGAMNSARGYHTATLLPNGKVLIAGGVYGGGSAGVVAAADLYDPATRQFTAAPALVSRRYAGTATLLPNGKVLIAGGHNGSAYVSSAELYDPATGAFLATGSMAAIRGYDTATLLPNGKVLIAGSAANLSSAELYDPATGQFSPAGSMSSSRFAHTATLLPNGNVLIAGGHNGSAYVSSADLYDPATGTFSTTGPMAANRGYHTATLLPNGKVLMAGGAGPQSTAELYDPNSGRFVATTSNMLVGRSELTATLLPDGKVLLAGGNGGVSSAELYDPVADLFVATSGMTSARAGYTATLLPSGQVLLAGGYNGTNAYVNSADVYDPATSLFSTFVFDPRSFSPPLDADGDNVFHFTTITIPSGVTVRLSSDYVNGPVYWLASGAVSISGTVSLSGQTGHNETVTPATRRPPSPGPGGFSGGAGGQTWGAASGRAQAGLGPLGGKPGNSEGRTNQFASQGGSFSGNEYLVPLVGGSGGGGGNTDVYGKCGGSGGAGGGALLIASSISVSVTGQVLADGGQGGSGSGTCGYGIYTRGWGGAGAGGAIRIVAPLISGSGTLAARGVDTRCEAGTSSAAGRVRLEAFSHQYSFSMPGTNWTKGSPVDLFLPTSKPPALRVVSVAGVPVAPNPTGSFELPDVTINEGAATIVEIEARGIPPGTIVKLYLFSLEAADTIVDSAPLEGTLEHSTTTASVVFPPGFTRGFPRAVWR